MKNKFISHFNRLLLFAAALFAAPHLFAQIQMLESPPAVVCGEKVFCLVVAADGTDGEKGMEPMTLVRLFHSVFADLGINADFHIADGAVGNDSGEAYQNYMRENGCRAMITLVSGTSIPKMNNWSGKTSRKEQFALVAMGVSENGEMGALEGFYSVSADNSEDLIAQFQSDMAAIGDKCAPLVDPGMANVVELEGESQLKQGQQYDAWPSNLKNATLLVPLYAKMGAPMSGNAKQDKRMERYVDKMNKAIDRKNEELEAALKGYDHPYVLAPAAELDAYKGKAGHFMVLDRARVLTEQVYNPNGTNTVKSYTSYRYALMDMVSGDVYEGEGKEAKSTFTALRNLLKAAEKQ